MSLDPAILSRIQSLLDSNRMVLFMKGSPDAPQCGFSAKAVATLDEMGAEYAHINVLADADIREGIKLYGDWPTIPQLYVGGELLGGSDIIVQMAGSGELQRLLGLPEPDRTPPSIEVSAAALDMLRGAIANAGGGLAVVVAVDKQYRTQLQLAPADPAGIAIEVEGVRFQFDGASARRANGLQIDFANDHRGRGLMVEHPLAPPAVRAITPVDAGERAHKGELIVVDVRPADERALAAAPVSVRTIDDGIDALAALPRDTALAFLCHHGGRSAQAAEHFRGLGFREVYNIHGGIDAWADADPAIARY
ncbi:Grx4 family monothiol glutaredoxin [Solilutibacter silvestris]|uniref:Monothiol glutaredoxin, Grx4 family n=1 Tax=Solilutibacter silvestris TaxID=1645665 RepID=A0A2K1Q1Q1_9GAMM|nr:Grx4 family monothiol glutaredoxin [Lysobacter silvestris]PNS08954.1 monothiol glutaredoxin, Grx4 family [Lysobacter silvestris]